MPQQTIIVSLKSSYQFFHLLFNHLPNRREKRPLPRFPFYKHIGMYAFRTKVLAEVTALPQSSLEKDIYLEIKNVGKKQARRATARGSRLLGIVFGQRLLYN